jgi:hypothetical protein
MTDQIKTAATGIAIVFAPLSLFTAASGITIGSGGLMVTVADLDTLFLDISTFFVLALLWKRRGEIGDRRPFVLFVAIFAATTAMLLGYVVTNYGTLWRLRSLVAVPVWMAVVALSKKAGIPRDSAVSSQATPLHR